MHEIALSNVDESVRRGFTERCKAWASSHQAEVGVAEMAMGAALLAWGVSSGHVLMGEHVVASKLSDVGAAVGTAVGGIAGAGFAATLLKGLFVGGVALVQGTVAVPALVLVGGGAMVLGAFGYTIGDVVGRLLEPNLGEVLGTASALAVGLALLVDGARRFIKDERILAESARFVDGVVHLVQRVGEVIATTFEELQEFAREFSFDAGVGTASLAGGAAAGGALGASLAAGSVTVLGSHSLGAVALTLGVVSAPVWPIVVGCAAGLSASALAFLAVKRYARRGK